MFRFSTLFRAHLLSLVVAVTAAAAGCVSVKPPLTDKDSGLLEPKADQGLLAFSLRSLTHFHHGSPHFYLEGVNTETGETIRLWAGRASFESSRTKKHDTLLAFAVPPGRYRFKASRFQVPGGTFKGSPYRPYKMDLGVDADMAIIPVAAGEFVHLGTFVMDLWLDGKSEPVALRGGVDFEFEPPQLENRPQYCGKTTPSRCLTLDTSVESPDKPLLRPLLRQ